MRRLLLFPLLLILLAAAAPAQAATTVTAPSGVGERIVATATSGADILDASALAGTVRISDPTGVTLVPGITCTAISATVVECAGWHTPEFRLGSGPDRLRLDGVWNGMTPAVRGDRGNDVVESATGELTFAGGSGADTLTFAPHTGPGVDVTLGTDITSVEVLEGSSRDDRLQGSRSGETIRGGAGRDTIDPGAGADTVDAGDGHDTVSAIDGVADTIHCGGGSDALGADAFDHRAGDCETVSGPGIDPAPTTGPRPAHRPPATADPTPPPAPARRATISVLSRPAADAARTRIGTRVRVPMSGAKLRMTVRHGERQVGQTELVAQNPGEAVVNVPLDAAVRQAAAHLRHVELTALVELQLPGDPAGVGEEYTATVVEPPPFVRGRAGVRKRGGFGEQRLAGTRRSDTLSGESGDDTLLGRAGNDDLHGGTGNDRLLGSAGNDRLDGYDGDDTLYGGPGDDLIVESRFGDDTLHGGPGDDWIVGARGTDHITGGSGDDVIFGGSGSDTIDCGPGNDTAFVNLDIEKATARGCETILFEDDIPSIRCPGEGTGAGETMLGSDGPDICKGNGGDDDVEGAGGDDQLFGGDGDDRIFGRFGNDQMFGGAGDDEMEGGRGNDRLSGGPGNDQLNGGYGRDRLDAGPGNDTIISRGGGADQVDCGPGRDVVTADRSDRLRGCEIVRWK